MVGELFFWAFVCAKVLKIEVHVGVAYFHFKYFERGL